MLAKANWGSSLLPWIGEALGGQKLVPWRCSEGLLSLSAVAGDILSSPRNWKGRKSQILHLGLCK